MCRYCNFNVFNHYLFNVKDSFKNEIEPETDKSIDDLIVTEISATESVTSTYKVPDNAFDSELKSQRKYSAILVNGGELPDWISLDAASGEFTIKPEYEEIGTHEIIVQATDQFGESATSLISLDVQGEEGEDSLLEGDQKIPAINDQTEYNGFVVAEATALPNIFIDDVQTTDSSVGRDLTFTVSLDAASSETVTIDYATVNNTAVTGEDYIPVSGKVTFAPGETEKTITVKTTGTSYLDPDESFWLNLSNPNYATIEDGQGKGSILPAYAGIRGWQRNSDTITFSFFNEDVFGQGGYDGSTRESNAREVSEVVKASYRQIFDNLSTFADRNFVEVEESEAEVGHIRIVVSDGPDYAYAGGHIHLAGWAAASDAGINGWESNPGVYAYSALIHELGHALGMPHSFGKSTSVFDPEENSANSVMSYTFRGNHPATFMAYDIKSLQERYGAKEYRPEDTVYEFVTVDNYVVDGELSIDTPSRMKQTIWDSAGIDTFDFSALEVNDSGYRFDLNQSKYQTTQAAYQGSSYSRNGVTYYVPTYGTSIAIDVEIENLINSSSDDLIIANPAANIFSGYGLGLTTGDDVLIATDNLDKLDLSGFSFLDVSKTSIENDLKIEFGLANSIIIKDYFAVSEEDRINILFDNNVDVSINDLDNILEGDNGVKIANFTVNLAAAHREVIEIDYTTVDGSAKAGTDYVAKEGTVTFNPGETSKTISVEVLGDTVAEAFESFGVDLLGNEGRIINHAEGIIADNDGVLPLPSLTIKDTRITKGNKAALATFTVSLDRSYDTEITVDYTTVDGVAMAGEDYTVTSGTLAFAPGETEKNIEVDLIGDSLSNGDEDFRVELSNASSNVRIYDGDGIGNIIDRTFKIGLADGTDANLNLASYPPDGKKDLDNLPFEITPDHNSLSITGNSNGWKEIPLGEYIGDTEKPLNPYTVVEFDFRSTDEGKLHGIHFESGEHHAFYSPWERNRFFQLYGSGNFGVQDFNNYEDSSGEWKTYQIPVHQYFDTTNWRRYGEWVVFAHEGDSDASNTQFRNLQLKELLPISITDVTANEGDGVAKFSLTIPEASNEVISLDYVTADDTAIAGQDYIAASGTVIFNPGETEKIIEIAVKDDNESEDPESFSLDLSNVNNGIALNSKIIATITDNDIPLPIISVADIELDEGNRGDTTATVTVSLDKSGAESISVDYSTLDNTANAVEDYQAVNGTIIFAPGEVTKTIEIAVKGDVLNETNESFAFNLVNAVNAKVNNSSAEVIINNDDTLPQINIKDAGVLSSLPVRDGDGNIKNTTGLLFEITLDAPSNQTVKVNYATADGTAIVGEDYSSKNKTLTFQPGETAKQVFVGVTLDETDEADENLYLNLSNPVNAIIADNQAVGTIEETRSLFVSDVEISEDGTEAVFTVSLDQPSVHTVIANYSTEDGTAKAGADYIAASGRFGIKAGETSVTVAVSLIDNKLTEENENFFLNLTKPKYVLVEDEQGQATILNDDAIPVENPGGIYQDLQLWLKADADVTTSEGKVATWKDSSQAEIDLGQDTPDNRPTLEANGLNSNPVISFDGENDSLASLANLPAGFATSDASIFIVSKSNRSNQRSSILAATPDNTYKRLLVHLPYKGNTYFDRGNIHGSNGGRLSTSFDTPNSFQLWNFQTETDVGQSIIRNGLEIVTDDDTSESFDSTDKTLELSSTISADAFEGDIAEVIIFNQALSSSDRNGVDSYLGIKYGFTLDQTNRTNYVTSDGAVIWNAVTAGDYNHDIAGIAIDTGSGLDQVQSRSSNEDGIVTISNPSNLEDGEALTWSNDNGAISAESVTLNNDTYYLTRQWRVQQRGDVGTVDLSFDLTGLGYLTDNPEDFSLLIDDDGDFSNATRHQTGLEVNGNQISFTDVNLQDGSHFSLSVPEKEAPGGIKANLQLWLTGDSAEINDDGNVTAWSDRSGKNRNYTPKEIDNQPVLKPDQFNFNPVVSFAGNDTLITSREHFTQGEVFFILKGQDEGNSSSLLSDRSGYNNSYLRFEQWSNKGKLGFTRRGIKDYTSQVDSPFNQLSLLGFSSEKDSNIYNITVENNGKLIQDSLDIGATRPLSIEYLASGFKGEIAEVIVFDSVLNETDKLKLRSNLAIKYGLTLDQTPPTNYLNSDNQVWWNAEIAGEYNKDLAGIVKDESSDLAQVKSRSSNPDSIITMTAEDTVNGLEDGEALIWGNQDQTTNKKVLQLDGVNDYLAIPDSDAIDFSSDQDFTVEVKVKTDGSTANDAIIEKWSQSGGYPFVIRYGEDGTVLAARYDKSNNPAVKSSTKINDGKLHHIAFVKEGEQLKLYIDGELESTTTDTTTGTTTNNSPLYLGSRGGNKEFFNGNIDDLRIWNVARSAAEIKNNKNSIDSNNNDLVAYLSLDNDANDLTGNGNNGTFHNEASIVTIETIDLSQRIWQVQEKQGDVGKVSVSFDLSNLGQQLPLEKYALKIADNDNFDNAKFHTIESKIENNTLTFRGVDFKDTEYFTLDTEYDPSLHSQHIGEIGKISNLDHFNQTIQLNNSYENPIIFALPLSYNGGDPAITRITEIQDDNFSLYLQEAEYRDGPHVKESLSYLVLEAGIWELADGTMLEVGSIDTKSTTTTEWESIDFASDFQETPAILSQVQTQNGLQFVRTRQKSSNFDGFQLAMEEEEALRTSGHTKETVGWLAIESGSGSWDDKRYKTGHTGHRIDHTWDKINFNDFDRDPSLFASVASYNGGDSTGLRYQNLDTSQVQIKLEEDRSLDSEIGHVDESVDFLAISGLGDLTAFASE